MTDCSLYLVSPPAITLASFMPEVEEALGLGAVKAFQLRLKNASDVQIFEAAAKIQPICQKYSIAFILNDRVDLVKKCSADGVHLGQEDMSVAEARKILGEEFVIGATCHASRDLAIDAASAGANYVAFGAFFPTISKSAEKIEKWGVPKPEILEFWSTATEIPCVAIGGITPQNCKPLIDAGADFIAVINAVWKHPQGAAAGVRAFGRLLKFC